MHIILPIIGALVGASLASDSRWFFGLIVGAFAGYVMEELRRTRRRVKALEEGISAPRKVDSSRAARPEASEAAARRAPEAVSPAAPPLSSQTTTPSPPSTSTSPDSPRSAPAAPSELAIIRLIRGYFTGGNTLVRVGVVILFFGVAFLLRYVAEHARVPVELRLTGVALGAIVLLGLGWRLRTRRAGYALALQGGAVGILYLIVFAALRIYGLIPAAVAFPLLVSIAVFSAVLAILQNSLAFALLGVTGGFLAPVLAATGQGNHVVLFSYYSVLNAGILTVAWFKAWRPLNLAGFLFTFVIGAAWGVLRYRAGFFPSTEPFLALFFLFYVAIAILFALRQPPQLRGYVDGTLIFGTPIIAFGLQAGMLRGRPFLLAYSALAVSALYLTLAWILQRRHRDSLRLLIEAFMALGVAFLTLAVPLALDGRWSAATWALEGAALVWIGCRQNRRLPRAAGALLQIAGGIIFWRDVGAPFGDIPLLNSAYLGGVMLSAASVFSACVLHAARSRLARYESAFSAALFFWGLLWWLIAGLAEIGRHVPNPYGVAAALVFFAITAWLSSEIHRRFQLSVARLPALWLLPVMALFALAATYGLAHPFENGGWAAWPLAFATFYALCRRHEGEPGSWVASALHVGSAWLLIALLSWEVAWAINRGVSGSGSWPAIAWALVPGVVLFVLSGQWPFELHRRAYVVAAGGGLAVYLALWSLITNLTLRGAPHPLSYIPLLNPLDLAQAFVLLVLVRYWLHVRAGRYIGVDSRNDRPIFAALAALGFVWLNAALLRTFHHWAGVPFELDAMLGSTLVQASLSIFWTVLALAAMLIATRRGSRAVWLTGAGLLIVVVAKLFLVDLSRIGGIERIVSFVGVGLLMLVIGYFSPLPPAAAEQRK